VRNLKILDDGQSKSIKVTGFSIYLRGFVRVFQVAFLVNVVAQNGISILEFVNVVVLDDGELLTRLRLSSLCARENPSCTVNAPNW
jgi:hypothetical protein